MLRPFSQNLFVQLSKNTMSRSSGSKSSGVRGVSTDKFESFTVLDAKDFNDRVKGSKLPVIIDFFATWCSPCKLVTPRLEAVIAERKGKILLAKVDVDDNTDLAMDYEVSSVPAILAMENGEVVAKLVGLQDEDKLRKFVDKILREHDEEMERTGRKKASPE